MNDVETVHFPALPPVLAPWLKERLTARSTPARVEAALPTPRPARLVVISHAGGVRLDIMRRQVRLLVECWDATTAADLAEVCSSELEAASRSQIPVAPGVWLTATPEDFSTPVYFRDPASTSPRYQFTATLTQTGSIL